MSPGKPTLDGVLASFVSARYNYPPLEPLGLQQRSGFSERLESLGLGIQLERTSTTLRGLWDFFEGQFPAGDGSLYDALLALYSSNGKVSDSGEVSRKVSYLFMSKPGIKPNLEEVIHNAKIITSGLLERPPSKRKRNTIVGAVIGAIAAPILVEGLMLMLSADDILGRAVLDGMSVLAGAYVGGGIASYVTEFFASEYPDLSGMHNPDNYISGGEVFSLLRMEFAYHKLLNESQQVVPRAAFYETVLSLME